jgi:hypothetical protein
MGRDFDDLLERGRPIFLALSWNKKDVKRKGLYKQAFLLIARLSPINAVRKCLKRTHYVHVGNRCLSPKVLSKQAFPMHQDLISLSFGYRFFQRTTFNTDTTGVSLQYYVYQI